MDNKEINQIRELIAEIVREEIKKQLKNMEMVYDGKVSSDGSILIKGDTYNTNEIKNLTGKTLTKNSNVRVYARGGKMSDAYIGALWST